MNIDKDYVTAQRIPESILLDPRDDKFPQKLAQLFAAMNSEEQGIFFNHVAAIDRLYWRMKGVFQWRAMQEHLTEEGRRIIVDMKEHTE